MSDQAWLVLKRKGVAAARAFMAEHGIPLLGPDASADADRAKSRRPATRRELEVAISYAGKRVEVGEDGRIAVIMDRLPHPIYRWFETVVGQFEIRR